MIVYKLVERNFNLIDSQNLKEKTKLNDYHIDKDENLDFQL